MLLYELYIEYCVFNISRTNFLLFMQLSGGKGQIINLGAGFDTLYWRLRDAGNSSANFVELDFPSITAKKCYHIKKHKQLIDTLNTEGILSYTIFRLPGNFHFFLLHDCDLSRRRNPIFDHRPARRELSSGWYRSATHSGVK